MLETFVLLNIFVETVIQFQDSSMNRKNRIYLKYKYFMYTKNVSFDQNDHFNASLLNKSINFPMFKKKKIFLASTYPFLPIVYNFLI